MMSPKVSATLKMSSRHLVLIFAFIVAVSAMGLIRIEQDDDEPRVPTGDWPERFPKHPAGFSYKCKGRNVKKTTARVPPTLQQQPQNDVNSNDIVSEAPVTTVRRTTYIPTRPTTHRPTTTRLPTTIRPTTRLPTTLRTTTRLPTTFRPTTHRPTTRLPTTLKRILTTTKNAAPTTKLPNKLLETGTTFWIRTPTPPNNPERVNPAVENVKLGDPLLVKVPIKDPFALDAAIDPLDANGGSDDFDIKTVGTPKPPRAVVDPDA